MKGGCQTNARIFGQILDFEAIRNLKIELELEEVSMAKKKLRVT